MPPFRKELGGGVTLAAVDSVPFPWVPLTFSAGGITLQHARGAIAPRELDWLAAQKSERLAVLMHHYPLDAGAFSWRYDRWRSDGSSRWLARLGRLSVTVPMDVEEEESGTVLGGDRTVSGVRRVLRSRAPCASGPSRRRGGRAQRPKRRGVGGPHHRLLSDRGTVVVAAEQRQTAARRRIGA